MDLSRRDMLALGGGSVAAAVVPRAARAQTPRRGGTLTLRLWDPPMWDPDLTISYKTHIAYTFTHSRLVRHKAGPAVVPGTFAIEGDLAESWTQPNEATYVFKLRRGVRWHNKPPVNGRELTADDVRYTVERFLTLKGNANAYMLRSVERVEAVDRSTVKFTLKEPFAWFLDMLANPMAVAIVAKECVDKCGDLKPWESVVGTGPWMLDSYRPNVGYSFARHPAYFVTGLPNIDRIEVTVDEDNASRTASFLAGKYDLGWENPGIIARSDWLQIKDTLKTKRPNLKTLEFAGNVGNHVSMRVDQKPFSDLIHAHRDVVADIAGELERLEVGTLRFERVLDLKPVAACDDPGVLPAEVVLAREERRGSRGVVFVHRHLDAIDIRQAGDEVRRMACEGVPDVRPIAVVFL